jgi:hypothetical protein
VNLSAADMPKPQLGSAKNKQTTPRQIASIQIDMAQFLAGKFSTMEQNKENSCSNTRLLPLTARASTQASAK